ncbi:MAG: hypothetical protein DME25_14125, partial [Verrucomicrobia bacterium]
AFYGNPNGGSVASVTEAVVTNFVGGSNCVFNLGEPAAKAGSGDVTLTWSSVEGGTYQVSATSDFQTWTTNIVPSVIATGMVLTATDAGTARTNAMRFYRVKRTALASSAN